MTRLFLVTVTPYYLLVRKKEFQTLFYLRCLLLFCLFLPRSLTLVCDFPFYCLFIDPITILKLSFILEKKTRLFVHFTCIHSTYFFFFIRKNNMSSDQSTSNHLNQNTKPGLQNLTSHLLPISNTRRTPHSSKTKPKQLELYPTLPISIVVRHHHHHHHQIHFIRIKTFN